MRFISFCCVAMLLLSTTTNGQAITLSQKNAPLITVFKEIEKQSGYYFVYRDEWMKDTKPVTITLKNATLKEALDACFKSQPVTYSIVEKVIVVKQKTATVGAVPTRPEGNGPVAVLIKGKVKDETGQPMAQATVSNITAKKNTVTDAEGVFTIEAKPGDVINITFIGYETAEIRVVREAEVSAVMKPQQTELTTVKVASTGYQNISRERSAGAYSTVTSEAIQNKTASMNVVDRLEGLAAGLAINYSEGNEKILIRGLSSIDGARAPLYVVDGVPIYDYNSITTLINPNDVESISFLKDATATSIWGAAAANGVIVITTKKGKPTDKKIQVSYNGFASFKGVPDYDYQKMMNSAQLMTAQKEIFSPTDYPWSVITTFSSGNVNPIVDPA